MYLKRKPLFHRDYTKTLISNGNLNALKHKNNDNMNP